ncbi:MAG: pantetheine-phosphate adenylyltransferase, partial [bacterium]|nr:pantetheine-phosphate adenylyltransferase [bacterium]
FEYEFQFAHMAKRLAPGIEPVFLMTSEKNFYCSSSIVKEVIGAGGTAEDVAGLAPDEVIKAVIQKMRIRE